MQQTWLGVDLGTQSVRAILVTGSGDILGSGAARLTSSRIGKSHTQDAHSWYLAAESAMREALGMVDLSGVAIGAVCVAATSGSIALIDSAGAPVSDGLMYDDSSASIYGEAVRASGDKLWNRLDYPMSDSWALPKIARLAREGMVAGAAIAQQCDVVIARLVGHRVPSDWSHALKSGFDTRANEWPHEVFESLRIPLSWLPAVVAPGSALGTVTAVASERTGIPAGTPVIAGMTDGCASQIASGALELGASSSSIGTTLVVKTVSAIPVGDRAGGVYSHKSPSPDRWFVGGASNVGAGILSQLFTNDEVASLTKQLSSKAGPLDVVYPLSANGERFPFSATDARGFALTPHGEVALSRSTLPPLDLFAALLQGISFIERLSFEVLAAAGAETRGTVALLGGATNNDWWNQLRADVLERQVRVPGTPSAALGAAIIAASGVTGEELAGPAQRMVRYRAEFEPNAARGALLRENYEILCARLRDVGWLQMALSGDRSGGTAA